MEHQVDSPREFVLAGNALFTVMNEATGNRFTFKVKKHDEKDLWFVKVLTGPENENDYRYLGTIFDSGVFRLTNGSKISKEAMSFKVFDWFWRHIETLPEKVKVYHEGRCGRCGRTLTVPESILSGYGPECINYI